MMLPLTLFVTLLCSSITMFVTLLCSSIIASVRLLYRDVTIYRYIVILCDTLGNDTELIHIRICCIDTYIEYRDTYIDVSLLRLYSYVQYFMTDAVVVYCGCQFYTSVTI